MIPGTCKYVCVQAICIIPFTTPHAKVYSKCLLRMRKQIRVKTEWSLFVLFCNWIIVFTYNFDLHLFNAFLLVKLAKYLIRLGFFVCAHCVPAHYWMNENKRAQELVWKSSQMQPHHFNAHIISNIIFYIGSSIKFAVTKGRGCSHTCPHSMLSISTKSVIKSKHIYTYVYCIWKYIFVHIFHYNCRWKVAVVNTSWVVVACTSIKIRLKPGMASQ